MKDEKLFPSDLGLDMLPQSIASNRSVELSYDEYCLAYELTTNA